MRMGELRQSTRRGSTRSCALRDVIIGRNLILNHFVIVPLVAALLLFPKMLGAWAQCDVSATDCSLPEELGEGGSSHFYTVLNLLSSDHILLPGLLVVLGWIVF